MPLNELEQDRRGQATIGQHDRLHLGWQDALGLVEERVDLGLVGTVQPT